MPFKTISVDLDAYRVLKSAKQSDKESFSSVIKRTIDPSPAANFGELMRQLDHLAGRGVFTPKERAELRQKQRTPLHSRSVRRHHAS